MLVSVDSQVLKSAGEDEARLEWLESRDNIEALLFHVTSGETHGRPQTVREAIDALMAQKNV